MLQGAGSGRMWNASVLLALNLEKVEAVRGVFPRMGALASIRYWSLIL